jgi:glycosyltransferase involved in cell wall biosynthesis
VHVVAHRIAPDLCALAGVTAHRVARPFGAHTLGEPLLRRTAGRLAGEMRARGGRVVANGGNLDAGDVTWVHYVQAAYTPSAAGRVNAALVGARHRKYLREERRALANARLIVCNSDRTVSDVVERVGVDRARARRVYYGIDAARFAPAPDPAAARRALGWSTTRPAVLFVGALGDRRKGFDTLFAAWTELARRAEWDADLHVVGSGAELAAWRDRARAAPFGDHVDFSGYRADVPALLRAADLVVHPARYEAYGLAVHEALCCGAPAIVSASAGVAEQFGPDLRPLLLQDPESASELAGRLLAWRTDPAAWRRRALDLGAALRGRSWDDMGRDIEALVQGG